MALPSGYLDSAKMTDPNIGRVLINRYELIELIGQGSMGRVLEQKISC